MKEGFTCPLPDRWNEIYKNLCAAYEIMMGKKLPAYVADIWNAGGPPTPLILNGWVFSDDADKRERWRETLRWAEKYDLLHFTRVENRDQYFPCGCSQGSGMYFENEYRDYTDNIIKKYGLLDYVTLNQYRSNPTDVNARLPNSKGIYFVIYPYEWPVGLFLTTGTGGHFRGGNPNVPIEDLWMNWVEDADVLYIGRAGGAYINGRVPNATLKSRIKALLRFGNGMNVGHWGGRYLWQHSNSADFRVYWYQCTDENPVSLENELITDFENSYGKKPFANLV